MHDRKSWTRYCGAAAHSHDKTLREQCLATAQFAFESQYRTRFDILRKLATDRFRFS
jgi:hypothetical protein